MGSSPYCKSITYLGSSFQVYNQIWYPFETAYEVEIGKIIDDRS